VSPVCLLPASSVYPQNFDPRNGVDDNCDGYIDSVGPPRPRRTGGIKGNIDLTPLGDRFP
jgi:hypothetical protein